MINTKLLFREGDNHKFVVCCLSQLILVVASIKASSQAWLITSRQQTHFIVYVSFAACSCRCRKKQNFSGWEFLQRLIFPAKLSEHTLLDWENINNLKIHQQCITLNGMCSNAAAHVKLKLGECQTSFIINPYQRANIDWQVVDNFFNGNPGPIFGE